MASKKQLDLVDKIFNEKKYISNHFKILRDDHGAFSETNLYKLAPDWTIKGIKGEVAFLEDQSKDEYEGFPGSNKMSKAVKAIKSVVVVSDLAYELFSKDKSLSSTEKHVTDWMKTPNSFLFGSSPFEACLSENSQGLIEMLCGKLGIKIE